MKHRCILVRNLLFPPQRFFVPSKFPPTIPCLSCAAVPCVRSHRSHRPAPPYPDTIHSKVSSDSHPTRAGCPSLPATSCDLWSNVMASKHLGIVDLAICTLHQERLLGIHKTGQSLLPFFQIHRTVTVGPSCSLLQVGEDVPLKCLKIFWCTCLCLYVKCMSPGLQASSALAWHSTSNNRSERPSSHHKYFHLPFSILDFNHLQC